MASVGFIYEEKLRIYYTDLSGATTDEIISICQKSRQLMQYLPENSVYSLINTQGLQFNQESLQVIMETMCANRPFVRASAVFGLQGLTQQIIQTVTVFSGREVRVFGHMDNAKQWLKKKAAVLS